MDDETFRSMVQPVLANLFAVNDRGVRIMLLSNIPSYASRLEDKVVNDQVGIMLLPVTDVRVMDPLMKRNI